MSDKLAIKEGGQSMDADIDILMKRAFGEFSIWSDSESYHGLLCSCYKKVVEISGKFYALPGSSVGRKYENTLANDYLSWRMETIHQNLCWFSVLQCYNEIGW